nr:MAG TPA: hypothetical protein [Caudoviricetes sp.]
MCVNGVAAIITRKDLACYACSKLVKSKFVFAFIGNTQRECCNPINTHQKIYKIFSVYLVKLPK